MAAVEASPALQTADGQRSSIIEEAQATIDAIHLQTLEKSGKLTSSVDNPSQESFTGIKREELRPLSAIDRPTEEDLRDIVDLKKGNSPDVLPVGEIVHNVAEYLPHPHHGSKLLEASKRTSTLSCDTYLSGVKLTHLQPNFC